MPSEAEFCMVWAELLGEKKGLIWKWDFVEYFLLKHHVFMINMFTVLGNVSRFFCVCEVFHPALCHDACKGDGQMTHNLSLI